LRREMEAWLEDEDAPDAVRVLSGPAGAGKSSFARMFGETRIDAGERGERVVYVPLHRLPFVTPVREAVDAFAADAGYPAGILDPNRDHGRLLVILDGLDELAKQGAGGGRAAREFAE